MEAPVIKKYDLRKLVPYANICIIGKKKTGKTSLIKWILYCKHKRVRIPYMVSETSLMNDDFKGVIPNNLIHTKFNISSLEDLLKMQKEIKIAKEQGKSSWKGKKTDTAIVLDDILAMGKEWQKSEPIKSLIFNGRHYLADLIMGVQDVMGLPPAFRANIDYTIITKVSDTPSQKKIFENYWNPAFGDRKVFNEVISKCTEGYKCLLIDNAQLANSSSLTDCVYYVENPHPDNIPKHRLGTKAIWEFCRKHEENQDDKDKNKKGIKL